MKLLQTSEKWVRWWQKRKIDWQKEYLSTWNHPHRQLISYVLKQFEWLSLMEMGMGGGANIINIIKNFKGKQLGGIDINADSVEEAKKFITGGFIKVGSVDDIPMSDNATDVVLTDMLLIYFSPKTIDKAIEELKRVGRRHVVLCELHTTSFWDRMRIRLFEGYYMHDYKKLLEAHGFYDIQIIKIRPEHWPDSTLQQEHGYIIKAIIPKRK